MPYRCQDYLTLRIIAVIMLLLGFLNLSWAGTITLPKSGQITCYDASGSTIDCSGTGQDGNTLVGVDWPTPRFTDNGNNTLTDNLTGLIWLKDANCLATTYSGVDPDGRVTWQEALNFVAGINSGIYSACGAGYDDWRLPNRKELYSLIDFSQSNPALPPGYPFINVATASPGSYWSSTTYSNLSNWAWYFYVRYGGISGAPKTSTYWVWPVRGEYPSTIKAMPWNPLLLIHD